MRSQNKVILQGRLASNPEIRTEDGVRIANFPLAINCDWDKSTNAKGDSVDYHRIVAFDKMVDLVAMHMVKGTPILIEGKLQNRCFDGSDGKRHFITEVVLEKLQILIFKKSKYTGMEINVVDVSETDLNLNNL